MKKLLASIPLIVLMCLLCGCQDQAAMAELEAFRAQAEVEEENTALVNTVFQALNEHDAEVWDNHFAPDYLWYFPSDNPDPLDRDGEREFVSRCQMAA
jgi:hypothetical protein